jgi:hypothetical protein
MVVRVKREVVDGDVDYEYVLSRRWSSLRYFKRDMDRFLKVYKKMECNLAGASMKMRVNRHIVENWRQEFPWFGEAMSAIEDEVFGEAMATVFRKRKTLSGAQWLLLNHVKGRELGFGRNISIEEKRELTLTMRVEAEKMQQVYSRSELETLQRLLTKATAEQPKQLTEGEERRGDGGAARASSGGNGSGRNSPSSLH